MTEQEEQLIFEMRQKGSGYKAIATVLGKSRDAVRMYCRRNGLTGNAEVVALNIEEQKKRHLRCQHCSKKIEQKEKGRMRKFCSHACRHAWWEKHPEERARKATYEFTCPTCQTAFTTYGNAKRKYCTHECYIESRFGGNTDGLSKTSD
ncbi:hypothetical protein [Salisediminibacterium selenitireducens]|uniref:RNA polymerase subunit sigma-70 n=1 Tax=Bacillus selenitireducens (strain ATCC 700615 / DSM 15326 / MLS10) TaxID=439292 RepID=D6XZZ5_BACIE|nr:hypothetical protein [Salisediminibacterium selenitireducens]ADI00497.1 hypothetical protein Bsel_3015 [[Bacillus] selenitireducens MLS10]